MKKKKNLLIFSSLFFLLICILSIKSVEAVTYNYLSWDLVDSGNHLDYKDSTKYNTALYYAIDLWNTQKSGMIRPDTIWIIQDVKFSDVGTLGGGIAGRTSSNGNIYFAMDFMDSFSSAKQKNVAIHEIAHALRLDHNPNDPTSVVYPSVTSRTTLNSYDKAAFKHAYNNLY